MIRSVPGLAAAMLLVLALALSAEPAGAQPPSASYQGELRVSGSPFNGAASFKFAIVSGATTLWSNDGTTVGPPAQSVSLAVSGGIFAVRLGDTTIPGMSVPLTAGALQTTAASIRVWVNTGGGFVQLPDVPLASTPFALQTESARRAANGFDVSGDLQVFGAGGQRTVQLDANDGSTGALMYLYDIDSGGLARPAIELDSREGTGGGLIRLFNGIEGGANPNQATIEINAQEGSGPGQITLFDTAGNIAIELDAAMSDGYSRVITDVLQINGGMDVAERFTVEEGGVEAIPGTVLCISSEHPGSLEPCASAYDRRVAGIVSGAGGVRVGMLLGQKDQPLSGDHAVALSGRVYCLVDASHGAIEPGALLTTSPTRGHAMKATDLSLAQGAILGKAMSSLDSGTGLVLVLVSLQ